LFYISPASGFDQYRKEATISEFSLVICNFCLIKLNHHPQKALQQAFQRFAGMQEPVAPSTAMITTQCKLSSHCGTIALFFCKQEFLIFHQPQNACIRRI